MQNTKTKRPLAAAGLPALTALALLTGPALQTAQAGAAPGAVYVLSNQAGANTVMVYDRAPNGALGYAASVATGGSGFGSGGDPLGSQGALVLSSGLLFAVNAGSNEISVLRANGDQLSLLQKLPSGGVEPVSIAVHGLLVYVLNAGGTPNIAGFVIDPFQQRLLPLADSRRPLAGGTAAQAAEVRFSADGSVLLVTEKGTQTVDSYDVGAGGYADGPRSTPSAGKVPFGFATTRRGHAIVSEAGSGAVSSYDIDDDGGLVPISVSLPLGQKAPCWLITTRDGRLAFTANAGSGTISSLAVAHDGTLTLLDGAAGLAAAPLDMALTRDDGYLYVRDGGGAVTGFAVAEDGSLKAVAAASGIPAGAQGIAAQ
ncbi:MAG: beta-propeller fold lactonase family protein [Pseudomonadota bacterium]|nr:beta-propeller fold lactonase family protein [Pseudomonadota bacterium]